MGGYGGTGVGYGGEGIGGLGGGSDGASPPNETIVPPIMIATVISIPVVKSKCFSTQLSKRSKISCAFSFIC